MNLDADTTISPQDTRAETNVRRMLTELENSAKCTRSGVLLRTMCSSTQRNVLQFLQMITVSPEVGQRLVACTEETIQRVQEIEVES